MRNFALGNGWRWLVLGAGLVWAGACGSSEHHHTGGGSRAGKAGSGAGSGGTAGRGAGSAGTSGLENGGKSGGPTAGTAGDAANGGMSDLGNGGMGGAGEGGAGTGNESGAGNGLAGESGAAGEAGATAGSPPRSDKVDLLFVIDNSISMYEKQSVLAATLPKFVARLVDPWCTGGGAAAGPATNGQCPPGQTREMAPVRDMHLGIITTSLGDHGSGDVCSEAQNASNVMNNLPPAQYDDHGRLLPSVRSGLPSWNGSGFLNWDPDGHATPPGQSDLTDFVTDLHTMIAAVGAHGCGYESTLEATYRFLVDPEPPLAISHDTSSSLTTVSTDPDNIDQALLDERTAFLRPDSAVVIVALSDENDCSIIDDDGSQGWLVGYKGGVGTLNWHMPRANSACDANPNDTCCRPCSTPAPAGCPDNTNDSACQLGTTLTNSEDSINLRCLRQIERFGVDLLYPISRYLDGLTRTSVPKRSGGTAENPLLAGGRDSRLVVYAPIVGVPWQDIARDATDTTGLELMTARELRTNGRWPMLVGDFAHGVAPSDPFMVESIDARSGQNPVTGDAIVAPTSTNPLATINGHEMTPLAVRDDTQSACIFPLPSPIVCNDANADGCDCNEDELSTNMAICQPPEGGPASTTQYFGKAYPGIRHLELARELGDRAVVSSICARNTTSSSRDDYGYLPAMRAIQNRLTALIMGE